MPRRTVVIATVMSKFLRIKAKIQVLCPLCCLCWTAFNGAVDLDAFALYMNRLTDDTIEKAVNGTGKPSGKNKRKKKKKQKNQQIGVDNIRLTPVIVDQPTHGPSKSKAEQHKPSKRRPKRGSVQQLTLAFAENEQDNQNSQKPTPSNGDAFFPNSDAGSSAALASSSVPVIATAATKLKMNDKGRVRIGAGDAPRSPGGRTVTFAEEPAANTSATTIHGVPSHLMASPATSSLYVKPSTIVFDDDDDQFPPPPPVGFVNPTFSQQFDPPRQQSPRHGQRPVVSGSKLLLTHGSTGESMTDVSDVQENPLFAFVAAEWFRTRSFVGVFRPTTWWICTRLHAADTWLGSRHSSTARKTTRLVAYADVT